MKENIFVEYNICMKKCAVILILVFIFTISLAGLKTITAIAHPIAYQNEILNYAKEFNLKPELIASVINTESHFNKNAISNKKAIGLMQIKFSTAKFLNDYYNLGENLIEENLLDANTNIKYGCMYLNYLNKKFEDDYTALASYNAGETTVRSWLNNKDYSNDKITLDVIPFEETKNYISKIKSNLKFYKKVF